MQAILMRMMKGYLIFLLVYAGVIVATVTRDFSGNPFWNTVMLCAVLIWITMGWAFLRYPEQELKKTLTVEAIPYSRYNGYVYIVWSDRQLYKIGRTNDVRRRMRELAKRGETGLRIVHTLQAQDMIQMEAYLHQRFASKRVTGEWYALAGEDVEYIKSLPNASEEQF